MPTLPAASFKFVAAACTILYVYDDESIKWDELLQCTLKGSLGLLRIMNWADPRLCVTPTYYTAF